MKRIKKIAWNGLIKPLPLALVADYPSQKPFFTLSQLCTPRMNLKCPPLYSPYTITLVRTSLLRIRTRQCLKDYLQWDGQYHFSCLIFASIDRREFEFEATVRPQSFQP
jgi:hypothetical protein